MGAACKFLKYTGPDMTHQSDVYVQFENMMKRSVGYEPNPGVLEDLISSGNLNKITNSELRRALSVWKADLVKSRKQEDKINGYRDVIIKLFIDYGPIRNILADTLHIDNSKFDVSTNPLLQNPRLENNLTFFTVTSQALQYDNYPRLRNDILAILDIINHEIK
jgi:hypothetical protein